MCGLLGILLYSITSGIAFRNLYPITISYVYVKDFLEISFYPQTLFIHLEEHFFCHCFAPYIGNGVRVCQHLVYPKLRLLIILL